MEKSFEFAENVVGFMVNTEIDQDKIEEILHAVRERIKNVAPICLYLEDQSDEGISFAAFIKTLGFHFSHGKDLEKIAIVTDDKIFEKSMQMKDFIVPAKVKSFGRKERMEAMNWVME
ncbi:STAS/SEC14 domain-containing protein [Salinimicrobium terrae]|uniref:STAS/SEC14 domain-containing protein n=1 Tax=Salinimicrobium terrae TaxID=470866 RepID=UPI000408265D|nr:STAS/SEC14 domain-containing protein [Salinimicrobium terrae]